MGTWRILRNLAIVAAWVCGTVVISIYITKRASSYLADEVLIQSRLIAVDVATDVARENAASAGVHHLHGILRPDEKGQWFILSDDTHEPWGIDPFVVQTETYIRIFTSGRFYSKAGTIQISSDDGFGGYITGHASLGLGNATIEVRANGKLIDPADVWGHLPPDRRENRNGNFWINMTMIE